MTKQSILETAIALIDAANSEDPNQVSVNDEAWPKELLYSHRMSDMLQRYKAGADDVAQLAMRGQHIQRWKVPRSDFPMTRQGYHKWRTHLYKFHAQAVAALMQQSGYAVEEINRVELAVSKQSLKDNADTQLLEDISALVFIEHYMLDFATKHPEYDEEKWLSIIKRTWDKMTEEAQQFALAGNIQLPQSLLPLIQKAVST